MTSIAYTLIDNNKRGRLDAPLYFHTPIKGYELIMPSNPCVLNSDGVLLLGPGFEWDFGSYAIDTPAMVIASAAHDAFCVMTDKGLLPWDVRAMSDRFFRRQLAANGVGVIRRWYCWAGVRGYSKFVAYWRRKK